MSVETRIQALTRALARPLPGEDVKARMRAPHRASRPEPGADPRAAAVLILLYPRSGRLCLPLMRRTRLEGDVHSGQISLPGGGREPGETLEETALREAREELGIEPASVSILGRLSPQWIPVSGYDVVPVVAAAPAPPRYRPDPLEVEEVIEVTVEELQTPTRESTFLRRRADGSEVVWPCWRLDAGILWGATAMILSELLALMTDPGSADPS